MHARRLAPFVAFVALLLAPAGARAEDDLPGSNDRPGFESNDVALAEAALPADGSLKAAKASDDGAAIEGFLKATATAKGSDAYPLTRAFTTADGKPVTVVLADTIGDGSGVFAALQEGATKKGWLVRTLGHPARLVVVAGPEGAKEKALELQTTFAVKMLGIRLEQQLEKRGGEALAVANSLLHLQPRHALAHAVAGSAYMSAGMREKDPALSAKAPAHFKAALDPAAASPLSPDWALRAKGWYGQALLSGADGKPSPEALALLTEAVKGLAGSKVSREDAIGFRYDLACAYARAGEKDAAFEHLTKALEDNAAGQPVVDGTHWRKNDTDLASLRDDARFKALVAKYPPKKGEDEDGEGGMEGGEGGMEGGEGGMEGGEGGMEGGGK